MFKVFGKMLLIGSVLLGCSHDEDFDELKDDISELRKDITEEEPDEPKPTERWFYVSNRTSITFDEITEEREFEISGGQFEIIWGISNHPKHGLTRASIALYRNGTLVTRMTDTFEPEVGIQLFKSGPDAYSLKITYDGVLTIIIREYRVAK